MHIKHTSNLKITKNYSPASYSAICGPIIMHRTVAHTITALIIVPKMQASCCCCCCCFCCCCGVRQLPQLLSLSLSLSGDKSFEPRNRRRTLIICKNAKCGPKLLKFNLFLTSTYKFFQSFSCLQHLGAFLVACSTLQSFAVQQIKKLVSFITRGNFAFCIIFPPFPCSPSP